MDKLKKKFEKKFTYTTAVGNKYLYANEVDNLWQFIESQIITPYEERLKLLEEACMNRTKPVVNLDNRENNCEVCGYDHSFKNEWNENAYLLSRTEKQLEQVERETKRYFFKTLWRAEWGDNYNEGEIIVSARNSKEAEFKAWEIYKEIHNGKWNASGYEKLIELVKVESQNTQTK